MSKSEKAKLAAKEKEWDKVSSEINPAWTKFWKKTGNLIKTEKNNMMYGKKSKDKVDRFAYELVWWFKLIIIFLAFSYITRG